MKTVITNHLEKIVTCGVRRPGSGADHAAEDYIERELKTILESTKRGHVYRQDIPIFAHEPKNWQITLQDGRPLPSFYIPYTAFTQEQGVTAPLLYWGEGKHISENTIPDCEGKIVVVDLVFPMLKGKSLGKIAFDICDPDKKIPDGDVHVATWIRPIWRLYELASKHKAAGFIGILKNQPGDYNSYYAPYGFREGDRIWDKPIPGFWVNKTDGALLQKAAEQGHAAHITLTGNKRKATTSNIIGVLNGTKTGQNIIIGSHHDSPFDGASEDASGMSVVLGMAETLAKRPPLNSTLIFLASAGHFYGSIGTRNFIQANTELLKNSVAEIHIEHIALKGEEVDGQLVSAQEPEPAALFVPYNKHAVALAQQITHNHKLYPSMILPAHGPLGPFPPTDGGDFYEALVPVFNFICNPTYLLIDDDHTNRICYERLAPTHDAFIELILELDQSSDARVFRKKNFPLKRFKDALITKLITGRKTH